MTSAIPWILFRATVLSSWRRALPVLRANPLVALFVAALALALPLLAPLAGRRLGAGVAVALAADETLARSFAVSVGFTSALVGAAVSGLAPREASLGAQVGAAPVSRLVFFLSVTALPLLLAAAATAALAALFLVPFTAETPAGVRAAFVVLGAAAASASAGAALAEAAGAVARARFPGLLALAALAGVWAVGGAAAGGGALVGPLAYVASALRGPVPALGAPLSVLGASAAAALVLWAFAAATRPVDPARRGAPRSLLPVPSDPRLASFAVALKQAGRRPDLRRHALGVAVIAAGGAVLLDALLPVLPALPFFFAGGTATLGAAVFPLAARGLERDGDWLWRAAPERAAARAAASALASLLLALALVATALVPVALVAPVAPVEYAKLGVAAALTFAAALVAGSLVPWRGDRLPEQLASYAALVLVATALWLAVSTAARNAAVVGVPEPVFTALTVPLVLLASVAAVALLAERRDAA